MGNLRFDAEFLAAAGPLPGTDRTWTDAVAARDFYDGLLGSRLAAAPYPPGVACTRFDVAPRRDCPGQEAPVTVWRFVPTAAAAENTTAISSTAAETLTAGPVPAAAAAADDDIAPPPPQPGPAIVYVHGGGLIAGAVAAVSRHSAARLAAQTGVQVLAPEYRLAPEHPFPAAHDDVYAALAAVLEGRKGLARADGNAESVDLDVDPARVVLWGVSAGGAVAAGVALRLRDEAEMRRKQQLLLPGEGSGAKSSETALPQIAKLVLVCPMLDDRTALPPGDGEFEPFLTWTTQLNQLGWGAYLERAPDALNAKAAANSKGGRLVEEQDEDEDEDDDDDDDVSPYASPAREHSLAGMPPTYIDVGGLDLFKTESCEFAAALAAANVEVEFHLYPGVPHGFEGAAPDIGVVRRALENRVAAIKNL